MPGTLFDIMAMNIDGKAIAQRIRGKIKTRVCALSSQPGLAVLLVGLDPASHVYVNLKEQACQEAGIHFEKYLYASDALEQEIVDRIHQLNHRDDIHGILVQLPLPSQKADNIIPEIDPRKDVDGFHKENLDRLRRGEPGIASAVALGVMKLIDDTLKTLPVNELRACIVASPRFAEPIELLLRERNIPATVVQAESLDLAEQTRKASILIVAEGIPSLIVGDMVAPGAIVIDVGTTRVNEKLNGDVDTASVEPIAGALTPVPGGVGPMTVAMLLVNILKAYDLQSRVDN